jgi:multidrug efflux pump subunit AcrA (membrane-fusion protein)
MPDHPDPDEPHSTREAPMPPAAAPPEGESRAQDAEAEDDGSTGRRWLWWLVIIGLLAAGVGGAAALYLLRQKPQPEPPPPRAPYVELGRAEAPGRPLFIMGNGIVQARAEIALSAQVGGRVEAVHPNLLSGGRFEQGELLVRIEDDDYRNRVRQARATVAQREVELTRAREEARIARQELENLEDRLRDGPGTADGSGIEADFDVAGRDEIEPGQVENDSGGEGASQQGISPLALEEPQLEAAEAALSSAEAALSDAVLALERTTIEAPFNGFVRSEDVDVGQFIQPGEQLARIYSRDEVEVIVPLTSAKAALIPGLFDLEAGSGAGRVDVLVTADFGGERFGWAGYVDRARGFIDDASRTVDVVVRIPDPFRSGMRIDGAEGSKGDLVTAPPLLVGTYTSVAIEGQEPDRYLTIPARALRRGDLVWAIGEGDGGSLRLRIVEVEVLLRQDERIAISAPELPAGALLVTSDIQTVTDGMKVRTRTEDEGASQ